MEFIDLHSQYLRIQKNVNNEVLTVLNNGKYIMGEKVNELERLLANYVGVKHCISCANGTDALQLSLMSLGVTDGDIVFTVPFTFFATAEAISLVGARPEFVDIDRKTFNICCVSLESKIKSAIASGLEDKLKAIIAVDLFGLPSNYEKLESLAKKYNLYLIEDAAQGFGGKLNDKKACSFGDIATTSFFPAKPLGCYGDGGALFTNNDDLAEKLNSLKVHGKGKDKYDNIRIGMNSRLDTIQAAVLIEKLKIFDDEIDKRNLIAKNYMSGIKNDIFELPAVPNNMISSWAQFTIKTDYRDLALEFLNKNNIPSAVYYKTPIHLSGAYSNLNLGIGSFPVSEEVSNKVFSIPMSPYLSKSDQDKIITVLNNFKSDIK